MPSSTVENYLKNILIVSLETKSSVVSMGKIAQGLSVTPGTATTMIKNMAADGWISYFPRKGVRLTRKGRKSAMSMLRRHRLLETFLVETLGLDWSEIHVEAEELEHAISEKVLEKLDEFLGRPRTDPHGHPIPTKGGHIYRANSKTLFLCKAGMKVRIDSIIDQESDFLRFARSKKLIPGNEVTILSHEKEADAIILQIGSDNPFSLGSRSSEKILVSL